MNSRQKTPPLVGNRAASDTQIAEPDHLHLEVIAHEIEFVPAVAVGGVTGYFGRRCREDQPPTAGIDRRKAKHVSEEGPICLRVSCVDDSMHARDHRSPPWPECLKQRQAANRVSPGALR